MKTYSFTNILEYIPKRYIGLSNKQLQDRNAVYSFKNGNCPQYAKELLLERIKTKTSSDPSSWVVCFIPASTKAKHLRRYSELSSYLNANLRCPVVLDGIDVAYDRESGHLSGKSNNPSENMSFNESRFKGKKVVLIDDVRTRGTTFQTVADKMSNLGAQTVYGIFLAQTIHPNLPIDNSPRSSSYGYDSAYMDDFMADEFMMEELQQELMEEEYYQHEMEQELMADDYYQNEMEQEIMNDIMYDNMCYEDYM
jgi:predicted amidophosphoribosyltransferase